MTDSYDIAVIGSGPGGYVEHYCQLGLCNMMIKKSYYKPVKCWLYSSKVTSIIIYRKR